MSVLELCVFYIVIHNGGVQIVLDFMQLIHKHTLLDTGTK